MCWEAEALEVSMGSLKLSNIIEIIKNYNMKGYDIIYEHNRFLIEINLHNIPEYYHAIYNININTSIEPLYYYIRIGTNFVVRITPENLQRITYQNPFIFRALFYDYPKLIIEFPENTNFSDILETSFTFDLIRYDLTKYDIFSLIELKLSKNLCIKTMQGYGIITEN